MASPRKNQLLSKSCAKINLYLHLIDKRPDGYHDLDSLFAFVDLADTIKISPAKTDSVIFHGTFGKRIGNDNSAVKALALLRRHFDIKHNYKIEITKNIPVGSGLAGGSSNAYSVLTGILKQEKIKITKTRLLKLLGALGADSQVFIHAKPVYIKGPGIPERTTDEFPKLDILLVNPGIELLTKDVFASKYKKFSGKVKKKYSFGSKKELLQFLSGTDNDLYPAAVRIAPGIKSVIGIIGSRQGCLLARMSGSGATCFGIFRDRESSVKAARAVQKKYPGYWVHQCKVTGV